MTERDAQGTGIRGKTIKRITWSSGVRVRTDNRRSMCSYSRLTNGTQRTLFVYKSWKRSWVKTLHMLHKSEHITSSLPCALWPHLCYALERYFNEWHQCAYIGLTDLFLSSLFLLSRWWTCYIISYPIPSGFNSGCRLSEKCLRHLNTCMQSYMRIKVCTRVLFWSTWNSGERVRHQFLFSRWMNNSKTFNAMPFQNPTSLSFTLHSPLIEHVHYTAAVSTTRIWWRRVCNRH